MSNTLKMILWYHLEKDNNMIKGKKIITKVNGLYGGYLAKRD